MADRILFINKQNQKNVYNTDDVLEIFINSNDLEEIKEKVENATERLYVSWASVDVVDSDNEKVPIEQVIQQQETLMRRHGPITDTHTNAIVGETLAFKVMNHPDLNKLGVLHLNRIYGDNELDNKVWEETVNGERTGSSIGGFNMENKIEYGEDGKPFMIRDGFRQYETASVVKPANPFALNEAVSLIAKSAKSIKKQVNIQKQDLIDKVILNVPLITRLFEFVMESTNLSDEDLHKMLELLILESKKTEVLTMENYKTITSNNIEKEENVLNKESCKDNNKKSKGDLTMDDEVKKMFEELTKSVSELKDEVIKIKKQEEEEVDDEEMEKMKKEDVSSDIEGEKGKEAPQNGEQAENSNDKEVYKTFEAKLDKLEKMLKEKNVKVEKSSTPRPNGANNVEKQETGKNIFQLAKNIAIGKEKVTYSQINKMFQEEADKSTLKALGRL